MSYPQCLEYYVSGCECEYCCAYPKQRIIHLVERVFDAPSDLSSPATFVDAVEQTETLHTTANYDCNSDELWPCHYGHFCGYCTHSKPGSHKHSH
uniref:Spore coat protein n=1 Tax=Mesocestoides corti TaxID=53468 RepID=A0A5K3FNJ2_MESCO